MREQTQKMIDDIPAYAIGGAGISLSLVEIVNIFQQIGIVFGALLVIATFFHRIIMIVKDLKK